MNIAREQKIFQIYQNALEMGPDERQRFLAEVDDAQLLEEVRRLLADAELAEEAFPASPMEKMRSRLGDEDVTCLAGSSIGAYQLLELIGKGGMGAVYLAHQKRPIERNVALKVLQGSGPLISGRFEVERQALAAVKHPNIAHVYDAGITDDGHPFLVMEYLEGVPIHQFCNRHGLSVLQRLKLFIDVCLAIQHAHQKGVIHKDLKPSNILVVGGEENYLAKVIDFGIAEISRGQQESEKTVAAVMGTPGYMSPEQANPNLGQADTRTDIYALGVVLFELLAGKPPTMDRSGVFLETPECLPNPLDRDVKCILRKAMARNPGHRYVSAEALAADIGCFLSHKPIGARSHGFFYLFRRFVRRHRVVTAAACLLMLSVVLGVSGTAIGFLQAVEKSEKADKTILLLQELLGSVRGEARGPDVRVLDMLETFEDRLTFMENDDPEIAGTLHFTMANTYLRLYVFERAAAHGERALAIRRRTLGEEDPETLAALHLRGQILANQGHIDEAETVFRDVFEARMRVLGNNHLATVDSLHALAVLLMDHQRVAQAVPLLQEARERIEHQPDNVEIVPILESLAEALAKIDPDQALPLLRELLQRKKRGLGENEPETFAAARRFAEGLSLAGQWDRAEKLFRAQLLQTSSVLGATASETLRTREHLAQHFFRVANLDKAIPLFEQALALRLEAFGEHHPETLALTLDLGECLLGKRRLSEAQQLFTDSLQWHEEAFGPAHFETLAAKWGLAVALLEQNRRGEALGLFQQIHDTAEGLDPDAPMAREASTYLREIMNE